MHHTKIYLALSIVAYLLSITLVSVSASPLPSGYAPVPSVVGDNTSNSVPISTSESKGEVNEVNADQGPIPSTSRRQQGAQMVADIKFPEGIPQDWRNDKMDTLVRSIKENVDWTDPAWTTEMLRAIAVYISGMTAGKGLKKAKEIKGAQEDWSKEALEKMDKENLIKVIQEMWAAVIKKRGKFREKRRYERLKGTERTEVQERKEAEKEEKRRSREAETAALKAIAAQEREENAKKTRKEKGRRGRKRRKTRTEKSSKKGKRGGKGQQKKKGKHRKFQFKK
ncbi:hypothetical protein H0H93_014781, partial [Arthromyces matolae]